nr:MAG: MC152.1R [Molluscum contagiosum virus]
MLARTSRRAGFAAVAKRARAALSAAKRVASRRQQSLRDDLFSRAFRAPRFARRTKVNKHASWEQRHGATHVPLLRAPAVLRAGAAALLGAARELRAPATSAARRVSRAQDGSGQRSVRTGTAAVRATRRPLCAAVLAQLRQRRALLALCHFLHTQARRLRLAPSRVRVFARR